jgi:hypothetical protein
MPSDKLSLHIEQHFLATLGNDYSQKVSVHSSRLP